MRRLASEKGVKNVMFRDLKADEIEVRVAQAKQTGVSLLLYKDARVDQNILDETGDSCSIDWLYYKHTVDLDELQQERDSRP